MPKRTVCKHGHSLEDAYVYKDDFGKKVRKCAECQRQRVKRRYARHKQLMGNLTFDAQGRIISGTV